MITFVLLSSDVTAKVVSHCAVGRPGDVSDAPWRSMTKRLEPAF